MNTDELYSEIIPPRTYEYREGFTNVAILDKLTENEKSQIENMLIERLEIDDDSAHDSLLVETLGYLKSKKAVPDLKRLLSMNLIGGLKKLIVATTVYEITGDKDMIEVAKNTFREIEHMDDALNMRLMHSFFSLVKFNDPGLDKLVKDYTNNSTYLIAYNAKRALSSR